MRNLSILVIISVCLLSGGCSTAKESIYLTPVTDATLAAYKATYKVGDPINNKSDAVIVARSWLHGSRTVSAGDAWAVYAEQLRLSEVSQKIGGNLAFSDDHPKNMKVWLVIFEGEWQLAFPMLDEQGIEPTLEPPYHGCQFSLFASSNGKPIAQGEVTCPSETQ